MANRDSAASRVRYASEKQIERLIAVARACDLDVVGFEAQPDGTVRIIDKRAIADGPPKDEFEAWDRAGKL